MDAPGWARVRALFEEAVDLPPNTRDELLRRRCGSDRLLLESVRGLLDADARERTPVEEAEPAVVELLEPAAFLAEAREQSAGPYQLIETLGRGGMGTVYLAERADGTFERTVALKLVHRGYDSAEIMHRFEAERRILASLDHPNIARMYDAGVTSDGRPFLVMEHVEGEPIDRYVDRVHLDLRGRIELFRQICDAVVHAHRSLVIHRDLKPSNILVGPDGRAKLLDFGIAKLMEQDAAESVTRTGLRPLTPEYASPEQLRGDVLSTSTDVYSLGVVLYELLAGGRPVEDASVAMARAFGKTTSFPAIVAPSRYVERATHERGIDAARPPSGLLKEPHRLVRDLRGDLDRIMLTALSDDPAQRYSSVAALSEDLDRWLQGRPILARPTSLAYHTRKFVVRHRGAVAAATIAALMLVATSWVAVVQARRASAERDIALGVSTFLEDLFRASDPRLGPVTDSTRIADFLDAAALRVRDDFTDQPATRARLLYVVGEIYRSLSRLDDAIPLLTQAIEANRLVHGPGHRDEIQARELLAMSFAETGSLDAGLAQLDTALSLQLEAEGEEAMLTWRLREGLGRMYATVQRNEEALPHIEVVVAATRRADPFEPTRLASSLNMYGSVLGQLNRPADAAPVLSEAADLFSQTDEGGGLDEAVVRSNLAAMLLQLARWDEAEVEARRSLQLITSRVPERHQLRARSDVRLAEILAARFQASGDGALQAESDSLFREGLELAGALPELVGSQFIRLSSYGRTLRSWGRLEEAEAVTEEALAAAEQTVGLSHPVALAISGDLGRIVAELGRVAEGRQRTDAALTALEPLVPPGSSLRLSATLNHGRVLLLAARPDEALTVLEAGSAVAVESLAAGHPQIESFQALIAEARAQLTRPGGAS